MFVALGLTLAAALAVWGWHEWREHKENERTKTELLRSLDETMKRKRDESEGHS